MHLGRTKKSFPLSASMAEPWIKASQVKLQRGKSRCCNGDKYLNCNSDKSENNTLLMWNNGKVTKKLKLNHYYNRGTHTCRAIIPDIPVLKQHSPSSPSVPEDDKHSRFYMPSCSNKMRQDLPVQN
jgi:hypothetical protein